MLKLRCHALGPLLSFLQLCGKKIQDMSVNLFSFSLNSCSWVVKIPVSFAPRCYFLSVFFYQQQILDQGNYPSCDLGSLTSSVWAHWQWGQRWLISPIPLILKDIFQIILSFHSKGKILLHTLESSTIPVMVVPGLLRQKAIWEKSGLG